MNPNWLDIVGKIEEDRSAEPLYIVIKDRFKNAIDGGTIKDNTKLPTNRELSKLLGVDRSTVSRAYAELAREGYIESYVGKGTYSRIRTANGDTLEVLPSEYFNTSEELIWPDRFSKASQTVHEIIRLENPQLGWQSDTISFAGGIPTEEFYPHKEFEMIVSTLVDCGRSRELFEYSPGEGHPALRRELERHLTKQSILVSADDILVLSGSQQGLDIVASVLLDPGDVVAAENPTYLWATCCFKSRQARCLPIPLDEEGMRLDVLENALRRQKIKFIYVIPNFQNPTGITMSLERRVQLLELAKQFQVPILEDNFVGDLRYEGNPLPSLRAMQGSENLVIHQGTISKAVCPALRLGWLVAPKIVMSRLLVAKRWSNLATNSISQVILAEYLSRGFYEEHLTMVKGIYQDRRDTMLRALRKEVGQLTDCRGKRLELTWSKPEGGMFIWVKLPDGLSSRDLLSYSQREGVVFAPGDLCFLTSENEGYMRLCFIQTDENEIKQGVKRLAKALKKYVDDVTKMNDRSRAFAMGGGASFI